MNKSPEVARLKGWRGEIPDQPQQFIENPSWMSEKTKSVLAILGNTFLLPGLGTFARKRWLEGAIQCLLSLMGATALGWAIIHLSKLSTNQVGNIEDVIPIAITSGTAGLGILANWFWSIYTSTAKATTPNPLQNKTSPC